MKAFILLCLCIFPSFAQDGTPLTVKSFGTHEEIPLYSIAKHASSFQQHTQEEKDVDFEIVLLNSEENTTLNQNDTYTHNWMMIQLDENLPSGHYWIQYKNFTFTEHTFHQDQHIHKFSLLGHTLFSLEYNKTKDKRQYFLKTVTTQSHVIPSATCYTPATFSHYLMQYSATMLFSFFLLGLIFMSAIYNGALYLFNRTKAFLYYMLMQVFMVGILIYQTDIIDIYVLGDVNKEEPALFFYFLLVEIGILCILYFIRAFLETKTYLPSHDKLLHYITILSIIDLVLFFVPIMLILHLYPFILVYIVWLGWLRLKQGYKPALFFVLGWFSLMVGVTLSEFTEISFSVDPILIGSTIEALFLAIAISYKMKEVQTEKEEQKELLIHQSKLASMGEMLGNIAHQWRQPLSRLGYILMNIESKDTQKRHTKKLDEASMQLEFMSQTIDDFRDFYKPNKAKETFSLATETQKVITLLDIKDIDIKTDIKEDIDIFNFKNEYKQVILNLLSNAIDILKQREVYPATIMIVIDKTKVMISDNAGGIQDNTLQKIFEPYYSTKEQGLGIGLYMSKVIVEKNMAGRLQVENGKDGAIFTLNF